MESIQENYVLRDSVPQIIEALNQFRLSDDFKQENNVSALGILLSSQLRSITKDAHYHVMYNRSIADVLDQAAASGTNPDPSQLMMGRQSSSSSRHNHFLTKAEVLNGNIGYLKLEQVPSLSEAKSTVDAAMTFLENSEAFILDIRGNRGGIGGFIPYLMSYFFPADSTLLYRREMTAWDTISYHYTYKNLPGKRLVDIPTYILIDEGTGSAATNLAYTMQSFGRAILIGENTGSGYRGAHSASVFSLGNGLIALIPIGRVVNAITNTNWREEGVIPDIQTPSEDALDTAYKDALESLIESSNDAGITNELKSTLEELRPEEVEDHDGDDSILKMYVGNYEGGRRIWIEDSKLKYIREGGSTLDLKKIGDHTYKIHLPSNGSTSPSLPSVVFNMATINTVKSMTLTFEDGKDPLGPFRKTEK